MRESKIINNILYLKCSHCLEFKSINNFGKKKSSRFNASSRCYDCTKQSVQKRRDKNINKVREYGKKSQNKNKNLSKIHSELHYFLNEKLWFNRLNFHQKANKYAKKYNLYPIKCPICWDDKKRIQIHHPSYESFDNRKDVIFCCASCHRLIHNNKIKCPKPINLLLINKNE